MIWIAEGLAAVFVWFLGAYIFSFFNVMIYRVPWQKSFIKKPSYCSGKIPGWETGMRLFGGCMALLCWRKIGCNLAALTVFVFLYVLTVVALVDIDTMEIPNGFVWVILLIGLVSIWTMPGISLTERLIGMFSVSVPLLLITVAVPGAFGGGDIKLMGACGLLLGWKLNLISLFLAVLTGGLYGIYLLAFRKKGRKEHFAFGPFLCLGMLTALFWGQGLLSWYLGLGGF